MWDAAVLTFIVSASAFTFGSAFLSNNYRRLHHNDAAELRRRQRMIDVLRANIHVRYHARPLECTEKKPVADVSNFQRRCRRLKLAVVVAALHLAPPRIFIQQ